MAEMEGPKAIARDQQVRTTGYSEQELQAQFDALPKEIREAFQYYADGINDYLKEAIQHDTLPHTFAEAGIKEPSPWRVTDSVSIAIMMTHRFGSHGGSELQNARIYKWLKERFGNEADGIFDDMFWANDPKAPTTIPDSEGTVVPASRTRAARTALAKTAEALQLNRLNDRVLALADEEARQNAVYEYSERNRLPSKWGSYAWALSSQRTVGGSAILLGGPQMTFSTPSMAHEIHYSCSDLNVIGMGFSGVPGVLIGFNNDLAWTATSGLTDMVDIFAEKLDPDDSHRYFYKGEYRNMQKRVEEIKVRGGEPRLIEIYRTVHGPVIRWDEKAGVAYSRAASYAGNELSDMISVYGFDHAKNLDEFAQLAQNTYTTRNYIAATADGQIGYWHCGKPPVRTQGTDRRLPIPGTGEYEWTGRVPFSQMPHLVNPKQGYIINWNNKPLRDWENGDQAEWGEIHIASRIDDLIKAHDRLTFEEARDIIQDIATYDIMAQHFKPLILSALESTGATRRDARIKEAAAYLQAWDNHTVDKSVGAAIARYAIVSLRDLIFYDEFRDMNTTFAAFGGDTALQHFMQLSIALHVLEGRKSGLNLSRDYLRGRNRDQLIVEAFRRALGQMTTEFGPQISHWKWKQGDLNLNPLPPIPNTNRGTYIMAVELSRPLFRAESMLPPGQSESPNSPHYGDQREMAGYWRFKDLFYRREQLEKPSTDDRVSQ
jgi:penicillin amidase